MDRVMKPLLKMNANISGIDNNYTPLIIKPSTIKGINYQMEVASAQVKSAILLASLFSKEATTLKSKPYLMQLNVYSLEIFMFQEISHLLHFS
ncbi:3-phosphoshikimate 1-carboxyvinyltransferase [Mycobacteroides abscessus subsp. massiliense]|nr:3-phosphoshikimate 1-carboxyvinyltransferase [Mycobacteroides abscessus subsp. massiliense]